MSITLRTKKSRLLKLATRLEATPWRKFDQNAFCGTGCCIAGHAVLTFGSKSVVAKMTKALRKTWTLPDFSISRTAVELLGLSIQERFDLFKGPGSWSECYKTPRGNVTPRLAAKALRDLADTIHP